MKFKKHSGQACCGRQAITYVVDCSLTKDHLIQLTKLGFNEHRHFTEAGIIYVDNYDFILTGPFGTNRVQVKCKSKDCTSKLDDLEKILEQVR